MGRPASAGDLRTRSQVKSCCVPRTRESFGVLIWRTGGQPTPPVDRHRRLRVASGRRPLHTCRPLKGKESARGSPPNRRAVRRRLRRRSSRWAERRMTAPRAADEGQAPPAESIQPQQRANKTNLAYRPGGPVELPRRFFGYLFVRTKRYPGSGSGEAPSAN